MTKRRERQTMIDRTQIRELSNLVSVIPNLYYIKYIYKKRLKRYLDDFNQRTDKIMLSPQKKRYKQIKESERYTSTRTNNDLQHTTQKR